VADGIRTRDQRDHDPARHVIEGSASAFVIGHEHDGHHHRDDDGQNYRDAHEENQWRCRALTLLDDALETLHLGDRVVD
jgi:hypothetical protein